MKTSTLRRTLLLGLFAFAAGACGDGPSGPEPVDSVDIFPLASTLIVGAKQQLAVTVRSEDGEELTGREVAWSSSNTAVATVSASGEVTAVSPGGPIAITATVDGETGIAQVTVIPVPVDRVELGPNPAEARVGLTTQLALVARDASGNVLTGRPVTMTSSNTAVATVSNTGVVTGVSAGTATITATVEGRSATTVVNVVPGPVATVQVSLDTPNIRENATKQLAVVLRDASGATVTGRAITYGTSDAAVATVSATGVVTAVAPGTATITAASEGKSASITVTVLPAQVEYVRMDFSKTGPFIVGDTVRALAMALDSLLRPIPNRTVVFTSSNPEVATISSSGYVSFLAGGSTTFTATVEGKSASRTFSADDVRLSFSRGAGQTCREITVGQTCGITAHLRSTTVDNPVFVAYSLRFVGNDPGIARLVQTDPRTAEVTGVSPGVMTFSVTYVGDNGVTTRASGGTVTVVAAP